MTDLGCEPYKDAIRKALGKLNHAEHCSRLQWSTNQHSTPLATNDQGRPHHRMKKNDLKKQVAAAINACLDKKAEELIILEMEKGSGAFTDYFVLCSGPIRARCRPLPTKSRCDSRPRPFRQPMSR